ncbi:hypothetical protein [Flavobacterium sp. 81]|uniref:hypothetical protein n=1 Tax=Flavobacterium sp. 81 TaxID=2135621 RepID=UPI001F37645D|nr:hypothetical protein [Flavobacterium sp. 81]
MYNSILTSVLFVGISISKLPEVGFGYADKICDSKSETETFLAKTPSQAFAVATVTKAFLSTLREKAASFV